MICEGLFTLMAFVGLYVSSSLEYIKTWNLAKGLSTSIFFITFIDVLHDWTSFKNKSTLLVTNTLLSFLVTMYLFCPVKLQVQSSHWRIYNSQYDHWGFFNRQFFWYLLTTELCVKHFRSQCHFWEKNLGTILYWIKIFDQVLGTCSLSFMTF